MKFSAIFGSLAIYALQVHAIPTDLNPQVIQPIEASSPIPNTLEVRDTYCCAGFGNTRDENYVTTYIPQSSEIYYWDVPYNDGECMVIVLRNPLGCSGWIFRAYGCAASSVDISVRPAGDCRR